MRSRSTGAAKFALTGLTAAAKCALIVLTAVYATAVDIAAVSIYVAGLLAMLVLYFVLGTALDGLGMLILSLPFVMPLMATAGVDKVWFGIFLCVMMELAAVSPPVGITVAVMRSVAPDVPTNVIFRGCYPFLGLTVLLTFALALAGWRLLRHAGPLRPWFGLPRQSREG